MERVEEYLEAIYDLQMEKGKVVRTGDLAKHLNVKPSSVTEMLLKLKEKGYIDYQPYRGAVLTKEGEAVAKRIKRYHEIAFTFFKMIGIDDETASQLACELEHHLNDVVASKLCTLVAGLCEACEDCSLKITSLNEAKSGIYEVVAAPGRIRNLVKPGSIVEVRDGKLVVKGEEVEVISELASLIMLRKV